MSDLDARSIYYIGSYIEWLKQQDSLLSEVKGTDGVLQSIEYLLEAFDELGFTEKWVFDELKTYKNSLNTYKHGRKITEAKAKDISYDADQWGTEFEQFLDTHIYYEVNPKGMLDIDHLLNSPQEFFVTKGDWNKLSKIAKRDFTEGCRCLAFELPTPAVFLVMRCTEDVLRRYYEKKTGLKISGPLNWGNITTELKNKKLISEGLLSDLDYVRKNFRNPISHPEAVYQQKQAERLVQISAGMIEKIIGEM